MRTLFAFLFALFAACAHADNTIDMGNGDYLFRDSITVPVLNLTTLTSSTATVSTALLLPYLTPGSVLIVGAAGLVTQDNANFFWDATNHRLGIGTTNPNGDIEVKRVAGQLRVRLTDTSSSVDVGQSQTSDTASSLFTVFGSAVGSTKYGLTQNNLILVEAQTASALAIGTNNTAPIVFAVNSVEVGRFKTTGFNAKIFDEGGQVFNVKSQPFGAVGDDSTDDTAAINAAHTAAQAVCGVVYFPPATYKTTGLTYTDTCTSFEGAGGDASEADAGTSILHSTTNAPILKLTTANYNNPLGRWLTIRHLVFKGGTGVGTSQNCLHIDNMGTNMEHVAAKSCGGHGIFVSASVDGVWYNVNAFDNHVDGVDIDDAACHASNCAVSNTYWAGGKSIGNTRDGIRIVNNGWGTALDSVNLEGNTGFGARLFGTTNTTKFVRFDDVWDESNTGGSISFGSGTYAANIRYKRFSSGLPDFSGSGNNQDNRVSGADLSTASVSGPEQDMEALPLKLRVFTNDRTVLLRGREDQGNGSIEADSFSASFPGSFVCNSDPASPANSGVACTDDAGCGGVAGKFRYCIRARAATTGSFRIVNARGMFSRNAANSTNFQVIGSNSDNTVTVGDGTTPVKVGNQTALSQSVLCLKASDGTIGHCTSVVGAGGTCTCV